MVAMSVGYENGCVIYLFKYATLLQSAEDASPAVD